MGSDWLNKNGGIINYKEKSITINDDKLNADFVDFNGVLSEKIEKIEEKSGTHIRITKLGNSNEDSVSNTTMTGSDDVENELKDKITREYKGENAQYEEGHFHKREFAVKTKNIHINNIETVLDNENDTIVFENEMRSVITKLPKMEQSHVTRII